MPPSAPSNDPVALARHNLLEAGAAGLILPFGARAAEARPLRILNVMSFESPSRWTDGQLAGFKEALGDVDATYGAFQMDGKRNTTHEGNPAITLARAKQLGIDVGSSLLLTSEVVTDFEWNERAETR